jgi:predicted permease
LDARGPASADDQACSFSFPVFERFRKERDGLGEISGLVGQVRLRESVNGRLDYVSGEFVSGDFFTTLGVPTAIGRAFMPADDAPGADPVALLSYNFWSRKLGGDPTIVGKSIFYEGVPFKIAGVTAAQFSGLNPGMSDDVWLPMSFASKVLPGWGFDRLDPKKLWIEIFVRPMPGVTASQITASLNAAFAVAAVDSPGAIFKKQDVPRIEALNAGRGLTTLRRNFSEPLFLLMIAAGIVLLITCANLAGLILARSAARRAEISVRYALGASRWRIIRQLATENLLTAVVGGALGILLAYWAAKTLAEYLSANWFSTLQIDVRLDAHVLGFTIATTMLAALLFGVGPVIRASRDLAPSLKRSIGKTSPMRSRLGIGGALIFTQAALAMVVLAGAGLLVRTLVNLETVNTGFDTRNILLFDIDAQLTGLRGPRLQNLYRDIETRLSAAPGVVTVSRSMVPLLSSSQLSADIRVPGSQDPEFVHADELPIGPNFLDTMGIPLRDGRLFAGHDFDSEDSPQPAIVNEALVRRIFGTQNPIGRYLTEPDSKVPDWLVVGVAGDAKYADLRNSIRPTLYVPLTRNGTAFELRTKGDPRMLASLVQSAIRATNGSIIVSDMRTQTEQIAKSLYQDQLLADLSGMFGIVTLVLVCIGLYGLLSYTVANRVHEIGIRMALGAQPGDVLRLFVRQGCVLALSGTIVGIAASFWTTRFLKSFLYGVKPVDAVTLVIAAVLLTLGALFASWIPSRRAARLDPLVALRHE